MAASLYIQALESNENILENRFQCHPFKLILFILPFREEKKSYKCRCFEYLRNKMLTKVNLSAWFFAILQMVRIQQNEIKIHGRNFVYTFC